MVVTLTAREKRLGLHLAMEVSGNDAAGHKFVEQTHSLNISGGGICFECRQPVPVGARLAVGIALPRPLRRRFGNRAIYRARCVVCRVERGFGPRPGRVGARFLGDLSN